MDEGRITGIERRNGEVLWGIFSRRHHLGSLRRVFGYFSSLIRLFIPVFIVYFLLLAIRTRKNNRDAHLRTHDAQESK